MNYWPEQFVWANFFMGSIDFQFVCEFFAVNSRNCG